MASENILFGWDLTFKTVERDIKRKSDVIIAFIHWNLTKRGFRSIGIGNERTLTGDEEKSELLPTGWNEQDSYALRYVLDTKLFILHALTTEGALIINFMRSEDLAVSNLALEIDDTVKELKGSIEKTIPNFKDIIYLLKRDLIDVLTESPSATAETQTSRPESSRPRNDDPLRVPLARPGYNAEPPDHWGGPPRVPNVGRSDLDPFAPGGSGMLYQPFAPRRDIENPGLGIPGGLPRGAVPPGARFDPFGPPGGPMPLRRPGPPDADHLPPPGFGDDMFIGAEPAGVRFDPFAVPGNPMPLRRPGPPDGGHHPPPPGFEDDMFM